MADTGARDPDTGATVEFSLDDAGRRLPAPVTDHLRRALPGVEPERQLTDWGRSQRVEGLVDRTLYGFLYDYWFRVAVEGLENVPETGGALLVANHAGVVPSDGAMIARAVREEHPRRRAVHLATERSFKAVPGLGMLVTKLGAVSAHPANLHRLLFDERELVLLFPEGVRGARKALKDRYRLREFDQAFVGLALRAGTPIVPVAVIGTEEALPAIARPRPLNRLPRLPVTAGLPLPAKVRIRFLEPVPVDRIDATAQAGDPPLRGLADDIRSLIQENLLEMVAERRSVWLG